MLLLPKLMRCPEFPMILLSIVGLLFMRCLYERHAVCHGCMIYSIWKLLIECWTLMLLMSCCYAWIIILSRNLPCSCLLVAGWYYLNQYHVDCVMIKFCLDVDEHKMPCWNLTAVWNPMNIPGNPYETIHDNIEKRPNFHFGNRLTRMCNRLHMKKIWKILLGAGLGSMLGDQQTGSVARFATKQASIWSC